jgi:hypothetical protein
MKASFAPRVAKTTVEQQERIKDNEELEEKLVASKIMSSFISSLFTLQPIDNMEKKTQ